MPKEKYLFEKLIVLGFVFAFIFWGISILGKTPQENPSLLEVSFLDVGQGDSEMIRTPQNHYVLIDGGPDKKILNELGEIMKPNEREIEAVILTHPHADHLAGLNYVLDRYLVKKIYMTGVYYDSPDYETFLNKLEQKNIPVEEFYKSKSFNLDNVQFEAEWPLVSIVKNAEEDINDNTIVTEITYGKEKMLFLGDLSAKKQDKMLKNISLGNNEIVKVSHHGSKTGTSDKLLQAVQPKYAVISVGKNNRYGHPAPTTLATLSSQIILRTDLLGTINFVSDGNFLKLLN